MAVVIIGLIIFNVVDFVIVIGVVGVGIVSHLGGMKLLAQLKNTFFDRRNVILSQWGVLSFDGEATK